MLQMVARTMRTSVNGPHLTYVLRAQFAFQRHEAFSIEPSGIRRAREQFALVAQQQRGVIRHSRPDAIPSRRAAIGCSET